MTKLTQDVLAADKAGALHEHDWHTTFSGETRCVVCSRPHEPTTTATKEPTP